MDLIQNSYRGDPWKIMVCCILLNQTSNKQVRPLLDNFFRRFPDPGCVNGSHLGEISDMIKTTGFQNIKAKRIVDMSQKYIKGFDKPEDLPGVGRYGVESWRIFVDNFIDFIPTDKRLCEYIMKTRNGNSDRYNSTQV